MVENSILNKTVTAPLDAQEKLQKRKWKDAEAVREKEERNIVF